MEEMSRNWVGGAGRGRRCSLALRTPAGDCRCAQRVYGSFVLRVL